MPYSDEAKYIHNRQLPPGRFDKSTFKTVPLSHTSYSGSKFNVKGAKAVVGRLKKRYRPKTKKNLKVWAIQTILIPKK